MTLNPLIFLFVMEKTEGKNFILVLFTPKVNPYENWNYKKKRKKKGKGNLKIRKINED